MMTDEYSKNLNDGAEFQDYVTHRLLQCGIVVNQYSSKKYQIEHGESASGIEVKYDKLFHDTGNLYIEYQEKSNKDNPEYVNSGILRKDNTWLWVIGDYDDLYLIPKKSLQRVYFDYVAGKASPRFGIRLVETPTSKGMLLPVPFAADRLCAKHIGKSDTDEIAEF